MSTTANDGHFGPLVGLGRALLSAGHEVRVAAPESFAPAVERSGFRHLPFADAPPELVGPVMGRLPALSFDEANAVVLREVFGRIDAQAALPALRTAVEAWSPDLLVREPAELASLAAAERVGVPHVQVAIGMSEMSRIVSALTAEPLEELASLVGLADGSLREALASEPLLSSVPEVLDRAGDDAYDGGAVTFRYRDDAAVAPAGALPEWGNPDLPLIYVTFGSVTGSLPSFAPVFREALDGLADLPVRVFLTVGRQVEIARLGPVPANARIEGWWPQADVLSRAALLLGHGGFGTTMGAVAAGVPQVVAPLFAADQAINGRHVAAVGAGRAVSLGADVVSRACAEVVTVLTDPAYRASARSLAAATEALPAAAAAVPVLEGLAQ